MNTYSFQKRNHHFSTSFTSNEGINIKKLLNNEIDISGIKQIGNYKIGAELGSGAFGKVVLGKSILTNQTVAIKILDKFILSQTPEDYELVHQELSILKIVKHKYIAQLYEILETSQFIFIVIEYCEGKDLMDYILTKSKLSEKESLKFFQQLINTLLYLHSQNIAHRDIKIDNMLLDKEKNLKLVDFGLSTKYSDDELLNQPCGTVVYAAPEVLDGKEYHGMLADVWSSGIVLFGMISGFLPFCDNDDEINKKNVLKGKIDIPDFFPPLVKDLLKHMLDINPITRYTLQEIREHPWFNNKNYNMLPGIVIGYNKIPIDEKIIVKCEKYGFDKGKVRKSVFENKFDSGSALYYLLVKKGKNEGEDSVSDMCSEDFIRFVLDENNVILNEIEEILTNQIENSNKFSSNIKNYNSNNNINKNCDNKIIDNEHRNSDKIIDYNNKSCDNKINDNNKINLDNRINDCSNKNYDNKNSEIYGNISENGNSNNNFNIKNIKSYNHINNINYNVNEIRNEKKKEKKNKKGENSFRENIDKNEKEKEKSKNKLNHNNSQREPVMLPTTSILLKKKSKKENNKNEDIKKNETLKLIQQSRDLKQKKINNNLNDNNLMLNHTIEEYFNRQIQSKINIIKQNNQFINNKIISNPCQKNSYKTLKKEIISRTDRNKLNKQNKHLSSSIDLDSKTAIRLENKIKRQLNKFSKSKNSSESKSYKKINNIHNNSNYNNNNNNISKNHCVINSSILLNNKNKQTRNINNNTFSKSNTKLNKSNSQHSIYEYSKKPKKSKFTNEEIKEKLSHLSISFTNQMLFKNFKQSLNLSLQFEAFTKKLQKDRNLLEISKNKKNNNNNNNNSNNNNKYNNNTIKFFDNSQNSKILNQSMKEISKKQLYRSISSNSKNKVKNLNNKSVYDINNSKLKKYDLLFKNNNNPNQKSDYFFKPTFEQKNSKIKHNNSKMKNWINFSYSNIFINNSNNLYQKKNNNNNNNNKYNMGSSVVSHRKKNSIDVRDLSDSPNHFNLLNEKTRISKIPWKIKKDGIDKRLDNDAIYNKYFKRIKYFPINNNLHGRFIMPFNRSNNSVKKKNGNNGSISNSSSFSLNKTSISGYNNNDNNKINENENNNKSFKGKKKIKPLK